MVTICGLTCGSVASKFFDKSDESATHAVSAREIQKFTAACVITLKVELFWFSIYKEKFSFI